MSNLPKWPGASVVYSRVYKILEWMGANGHVTRQWNYRSRRHECTVSDEMSELVEACNRGDESTMKRFALDYNERW